MSYLDYSHYFPDSRFPLNTTEALKECNDSLLDSEQMLNLFVRY
jgi:hypothetical protein